VAVYNDTTLPGETYTMPGFGFIKEAQVFFDCVPIRYSSMHFCLQTKGCHLALNDVLVSLFLNGLPRYVRVRTRIHCGSIMELQYQLQSFGIPLSTFPFDVQGNVRSDILNLWFDKHLQERNQNIGFIEPAVARSATEDMEVESDDVKHVQSDMNEDQAKEAFVEPGQVFAQISGNNGNPESSRETGAIKPTENDVLFGKGYRLQLHPGNIRFREFLEPHIDAYENTPRQSRREVAIELVQILRNNGVRFLQKAESGEWMKSDNAQAEKKVAQYFRELRKKRAKVVRYK